MSFDEALKFTLQWEGGYVNDPHDPGGATNKGVTQHTYNAYRQSHGLPIRAVSLISDSEVKDVYRNEYWNKIQGDSLPTKLAIAAFDFAVNSGPKRALGYLQTAIMSSPTPEGRLKHYLDAREQFLRSLPTAGYYLKGWLNRLNSLRHLLGA